MKQSNWIFLNPYKKYANFKGRATRKEYWLFLLFNVIVNVIANILLGVSSGLLHTIILIIGGLFSLLSLIPGLAVSVRRLQDVGVSGLFVLVPMLAPVSLNFLADASIIIIIFISIAWIIVCSLKSQDGENKYGPNLFDELEQTKGEDSA